MQASVAVAAAILDSDAPNARLALCVLHELRDPRFKALLDALVETNPKHWPAILEYARQLETGPVGG